MRDKIPCPRCEELAFRVRRTLVERVVGRFVKSARYQCSYCNHEFTRYARKADAPH